MWFGNCLRAMVFVVLGMQLTGCGSALDALPGAGGKNGSSNTSSLAPATPIGTLSGVAKDALIQAGEVKVYAWNGAKGELLGSGMTDQRGRYSFQLQVRSQPVLLEVTRGSYSEEATGQQVALAPEDAFFAVQNYTRGQTLETAITYYTTLATGLAEHLVSRGMNPTNAIEEANMRLGKIIGMDILRTMPADIVTPTESLSAADLDYGFATAAVSSLTERESILSGLVPHSTLTSIKFIRAAYDDLRADGLLNGTGRRGDVGLGKRRLTSDIYRHELALHILRVANNERANNTGRGPIQLLDLARRLNDSRDPIFGSDPVIPIDRDKPNVTALAASEFPNLVNDAVVFGGLNLSAMVVSLPGALTAELILDGEGVIAVAADPANPSVMLDTFNVPISDGNHTLQLRVTDLSGAVGVSPVLRVNVSNQRTSIENISVKDQFVGIKGVQVRASIVDPAGAVRVEYSVKREDGALFPIARPVVPDNASMFEASAQFDPCLMRAPNGTCQRQLLEGDAVFRVAVTNSVAATFAQEVPFTIDLSSPRASIANPIALDTSNEIDLQGRYFDRVRNTRCNPIEPADPADPCELYVRKNFDVSVEASDNFALSSVTLDVDGKTVGQPVIPAGIAPGLTPTFTIDPRNFIPPQNGSRDGPKTAMVTVVDKAGNTGLDIRRIIFDTTIPTVSPLRLTPADGGRGDAMMIDNRLVVRGIIDIATEVQDEFGLASASLFLDLTPIGQESKDQGTEPVPLSVRGLDTRGFVPDAPHTFSVVATDRAGNRVAPGAPLALDFDNTAPTLVVDTIRGVSGGQGSCVVMGTVSDRSGTVVLEQSANVTFRELGTGRPVTQNLFIDENGTAANRVPVNFIQDGQNGVFAATVLLDGDRNRLRTFQIELMLTSKDALGNSVVQGVSFAATAEGNGDGRTVTCSAPQ